MGRKCFNKLLKELDIKRCTTQDHGIQRYTIQMYAEVYNSIKNVLTKVHNTDTGKTAKIYELMNKIILLGIESWSENQKNSERAINLNSPKFKDAIKMANKIV